LLEPLELVLGLVGGLEPGLVLVLGLVVGLEQELEPLVLEQALQSDHLQSVHQ
jgi:hypothetical protein